MSNTNIAAEAAELDATDPSAGQSVDAAWVTERLNHLQAAMLLIMEQNNTALLSLIDSNAAALMALINDTGRNTLEASAQSSAGVIAQNNAAVQSEIEASAASLIELINDASRNTLDVSARAGSDIMALLGRSLQDLASELDRREQRSIEMLLRRSAASMPPAPPVPGPAPKPVAPPPLRDAMDRLRQLAPLNFDAYLACLEAGTRSYEGLPAESCSTQSHPQALLFGNFLKPYLRGHVLDIGCGPQPVPSYLEGWPINQITGLDPISSASDHPFQFVPGIGELIPFENDSFGAVVSGTTLDHYYLLDRGIAEAYRVLQPGGHFVAWITEFAGAPAYDPYASPMRAFDSEHMYHIDPVWFAPMMERAGFREVETIRLLQPFRYLFMSFRKLG